MKRFRLLVSLLLVILVLAACNSQNPASELEFQSANAERYLVLFKRNEVPSGGVAAIRAAGGRIVRTLPEVGIAVAVSSNPNFGTAVRRNSAVQGVDLIPAAMLPEVTRVEVASEHLNSPTEEDLLYHLGLLWGINRVRAPQAWAAGYTGSHDTVVAVIDTGIASNHPDLAPNIVHMACYTSEGSHEEEACLPYPSLDWHGTHVAGTIAAAFGGGLAVGVGPNLGLANYNTFEIIPDCGVCTYFDSVWIAMIDASNRGYQVINMSLGGIGRYGFGRGTNELAAIVTANNRVANYVIQQGTTIVAAAGNNGLNLNGAWVNVPGGAPGIINTGATGIRPEPRYPQAGAYDVRAFYSNYGAPVDIVAPGGDCGLPDSCDPATRPDNWFEYLILSTDVWPDPDCAVTESCPIDYAWAAGTSMASPHVAGVAGLVKDANPSLQPRQVVALLRRTAENLSNRQQFGHGMVDAYNAVTR